MDKRFKKIYDKMVVSTNPPENVLEFREAVLKADNLGTDREIKEIAVIFGKKFRWGSTISKSILTKSMKKKETTFTTKKSLKSRTILQRISDQFSRLQEKTFIEISREEERIEKAQEHIDERRVALAEAKRSINDPKLKPFKEGNENFASTGT